MASGNETTAAIFEESGSICSPGERGLILPLFGDTEQEWPTALRIILYLAGLAWCFLGVAIVSDVFMGAIETITSQKARRFDPIKGEYVVVVVWNATVANLTLMALGSSAPEILLSCIELFQRDLYAGDLGPSTIVGSAAFNLLVIVAVCVSAIPSPEIKKIKEMPVYYVTATFSLFAYGWVYFILKINSENVVEIWEGVMTFVFFPILVGLAFVADTGYWFCRRRAGDCEEEPTLLPEDISSEDLAALDASIRLEGHVQGLSDHEIVKIIERDYCRGTWSRAMYHVSAVRDLTGGHRINNAGAESHNPQNLKQVHPFDGSMSTTVADKPEDKDKVFIEFAAARYAVLENCKEVKLPVVARGEVTRPITVAYRTREGSAKPKLDYVHVEGQVVFTPEDCEPKVITVQIVDDTAAEDEEDFYVDLLLDTFPCYNATLGDPCTATVVIIDDDHPGVLRFQWERLEVNEGASDKVVDVVIERVEGSRGKVACSYTTEDVTEGCAAEAGTDYLPVQGVLDFEDGQVSGKIPVTIKARGKYEKHGLFKLVLKDPSGGAKLQSSAGSTELATCIMSILPDPENKRRIDKMMGLLRVDWERAKVGHANWAEQFRDAIFVNGGEEDEEASKYDWAMHIISLPWKLLFALVPPTDFCGGWVCFCCSLLMIGGVTAVVGDMAALLGCVMDVPDEITAITFVALGTSLPDTFASKTAAQQDPYADASVGNVTGSNSVNVFLGLGLPWMIASVYWTGSTTEEWRQRYLAPNKDGKILGEHFPDGAFIVEAGNLGFSVSVFAGCACCCLFILYLRRTFVGGELGGPKVTKLISSASMFSLWLFYIGMSTWQVLSNKD
mmetsp:Transcript_76032/g.180947  ORF Transcript_76032/g.180947 Transcript_76032/m.180947 type:complete len:844 (+) Transcript_76032:126-2657(+)